jgi:predicted O-linked N-acetylglucosamine transferase (SPINDLY family)
MQNQRIMVKPNNLSQEDNEVEYTNTKAKECVDNNNIEHALYLLKECLKKYPNNDVLLCNIGNVSNNIYSPQESIKYYLKSLEANNTNIITYENLFLDIMYLELIPEFLIEHKFKSVIDNKFYSFKNYTKTYNHENFIYFVVNKIMYKILNVNKFNTKVNKIRNICYLTSDIQGHACSFFLKCLLNNYNKEKFRVYVYSNIKYDNTFPNITFKYIGSKIASDVVLEMLKDNINIVIDISGYTAGHRQDVMALLNYSITNIKLYTYLGYPCHTGLGNVIRISSKYTEEYNKNKLKYKLLDNLFLCYSNDVPFPKYRFKLKDYENHKFIGTFCKLQKITDKMINIWLEIMDNITVPFVFVLKSKSFRSNSFKDIWLKKFKRHKDKILLLYNNINYNDHLNLYTIFDLYLDQVPYNHTTQICEALYTNTPCLTMCLSDHVSRVSANILTEMFKYDSDILELITYSPREYIDRCVDIINNSKKYYVKIPFEKVMNIEKFMTEFENIL